MSTMVRKSGPLPRILTALVLGALVTAAVLYPDSRWLASVVSVFMAGAAWEWAALAGLGGATGRILFTALIVALCLVLYRFGSDRVTLPVAAAASLWWGVAACLVAARQRGRSEAIRGRLSKALAGLIVLVPAFASIVMLHRQGQAGLLVLLLSLVWASDTVAYYAGRLWGHLPLCSRISPGKTWAGLYAALASAPLVGLAYCAATGSGARAVPAILTLSVVTVAAGVVGDLLESMMKRSANMKDSGSILPGHGGVLDRIDSLTAAGPVFFTVWHLLGGTGGIPG